jgi:pimeloyl-ACP methyl ester carboxylesterase
MHTCPRFLALFLSGVFALAPVRAAQPGQSEAQRAQEAAERARHERMPDTPGTGRFPAMKEEPASLPNRVLYRPANLAGLGSTKLGVYLFGNGACVDDGASSRLHLLEVASHGYLAIAPGRILSGPGAKGPPPPAPSSQPAQLNVKSSYTDLLTAIDWAIAQNADPASPYYQRIDIRAIAASGYSCGGAQAMRVAADARVKTLVMMNSGLFNDGQSASIPEMDVRKAALKSLHTPVLYVIGGETDVAYGNSQDDFGRIDHVPVLVANLNGVGHGGTYWDPNGGKAATVVVAWLDWQLRGDQRAKALFAGADCGLCRDRAWTVQKKRID